jgi:hypothetical protein
MIERSDDHRYRRTTDQTLPSGAVAERESDWQPGVTSITGMLPKGGLVQWAANSVARKAVEMLASVSETDYLSDDDRNTLYHDLRAEPDRVRDTASSLGTRVHDFAEHKLGGQEPIFADDVAPFADQYIKGFVKRYSPTPIAREFMVWGGDYGGTADLYCSIDKGYCPRSHSPTGATLDHNFPCRWLIDYKTSTKPISTAKSGFPYPDVALQLAGLGYADIWQIDGEERQAPHDPATGHVDASLGIDHFGVVAITPDDCQLIEYHVTEDEYFAFRALHAIHSWDKTRKGEIK